MQTRTFTSLVFLPERVAFYFLALVLHSLLCCLRAVYLRIYFGKKSKMVDVVPCSLNFLTDFFKVESDIPFQSKHMITGDRERKPLLLQ
jgi:hypothetical protein